MIETWRHFQHAARAAFFLVGVLLSVTSAAQTFDFQIMVNGPWAYVVDPNPSNDPNPDGRLQKRIVIVAPVSPHGSHTGHAFPGTDATAYGQPGDVVNPGVVYYFDFPPGVRTFAGTRQPTDWPAAAYPALQQVAIGDINKILTDPTYKPKLPRVVISLPLPDYYSTHAGSSYAAFAESKMDYQHITPWTQAKDYTIWMELHYQLSALPDLSQAGNLMTNIKSFKQGDFQRRPCPDQPCGFSIVMAPNGSGSETKCDSYSLKSFADSTRLWGLEQYARFPEEADDVGTQNRGVYHYDCLEAPSTGLDQAQEAFEQALKGRERAQEQIDGIRNYFTVRFLESQTASPNKPRRGKKKGQPAQANDHFDFTEALKCISNEVAGLEFGRLPVIVTQELDCARDVNSEGLSAKCLEGKDTPQEKIKRLLKQTSRQVATAAGGTDCHMAQMSINGAIF